AEANEAAIKLVRKWAAGQGRGPDQRGIVTFRGSFHGRTLATVTATAQPRYQAGYEPRPGGFHHADYNDLAAVEAAMAGGGVAAVLLEPVQGEGGVVPAAPGFLAGLRALCDRHGALLVLDEIQSGMGRTGELFAHWHDGVVPDIVTLAKALGGGFPVGATLVGPRAAGAMQFGDHGTTFGGNPLGAAVARVALRKLSSPDLLANVARQGAALRDGLEAINRDAGLFSGVRGRGLMLGAVLAPPHAGRAGALLDAAAAEGLLLLQAGPDALRFVPPLNIGDDERAEGLARRARALARARWPRRSVFVRRGAAARAAVPGIGLVVGQAAFAAAHLAPPRLQRAGQLGGVDAGGHGDDAVADHDQDRGHEAAERRSRRDVAEADGAHGHDRPVHAGGDAGEAVLGAFHHVHQRAEDDHDGEQRGDEDGDLAPAADERLDQHAGFAGVLHELQHAEDAQQAEGADDRERGRGGEQQ